MSWMSASGSLAPPSRCTVNGASPLTIVGFGGPISKTSIAPSGMLSSAVDPGQHDRRQHDAHAVERDLLEGGAERRRRDHVIDQVDRRDGEQRDGDAVA